MEKLLIPSQDSILITPLVRWLYVDTAPVHFAHSDLILFIPAAFRYWFCVVGKSMTNTIVRVRKTDTKLRLLKHCVRVLVKIEYRLNFGHTAYEYRFMI